MSANPSQASNKHITAVLIKALESEKGVTLFFESKAQATRFRHGCYQARRSDRKLCERLFAAGDQAYASSRYESMVFTIEEQEHPEGIRWAVIIKPSHVLLDDIEIIDNATKERITP